MDATSGIRNADFNMRGCNLSGDGDLALLFRVLAGGVSDGMGCVDDQAREDLAQFARETADEGQLGIELGPDVIDFIAHATGCSAHPSNVYASSRPSSG